jgi:hypothetical protein
MFAIPEQFSRVTKAAFDEQLLGFSTFAQAAFDAGIGIVDVHVDVVKESMAVATVTTNQLLCLKDGRDWMSFAAGQSQQTFERLSAYGREVAELVSAVHGHFPAILPGQSGVAKEVAVESSSILNKTAAKALPANSLSKVTLNSAQEGYDIPVRAGKKATVEMPSPVAPA